MTATERIALWLLFLSAVTDAVNTAPPPDPSTALEAGADPTVAAAAEESTTPAPGPAFTIISIAITPDKQDSDVSETTAAPVGEEVVTAAEVPRDSQTVGMTVVGSCLCHV